MAREDRQGVAGLVREAVTIVVAAGSAYLGIRVDLAQLSAGMAQIKETVSRHETQIDKLRELREFQNENQKR